MPRRLEIYPHEEQAHMDVLRKISDALRGDGEAKP
jgi:hypothetical protein